MEFGIYSELFALYGVPLLICLARITDVTIGTLRIIFVAKGLRYIAPVLGFFEIIIWLTALTQVMGNLTNPINFFAYALGFSLGNYFGIYIENRIALGMVVIRIITKRDSFALASKLRELGHSVTVLDAEGNEGPVNVVFTVVKRAKVKAILPLIQHFNPRAVYSIEDVRHASDPSFALKPAQAKRGFKERLRGIGK